MEEIYISSEILEAAGFHLTSGGRTGYGKPNDFAVFETYEDQSWFLDDCLGGTRVLYHIDLEGMKVTKLDSYDLSSSERPKYKNALMWYRLIGGEC